MGTTTRAAVSREPGRWWEVIDLELDEPRAHEVLVRFMAAGLCHSDDHVRTGTANVRYPLVGGHEGAGIVEAVGPGVTRVAVDDVVVGSFTPVCGVCRYCSTGHQCLCERTPPAMALEFPDGTFRFHDGDEEFGSMSMVGSFSRYAVVPEWSCIPIGAGVPFEVAAILGCGVPTGWGAAIYMAGVKPGDVVVVYGAGGVGMNALQAARYAGAATVVAIDPSPLKRELAPSFGATHVCADADEGFDLVRSLSGGYLADHAIVAGVLNDEVVNHAIRTVGKTGTVTLTAIGKQDEVTIHARVLIGYQRRIQGSLYGGCNPAYDIPRLAELYRRGELKLDEQITGRYSLDDINQGFQDMLAGKNIRGVVIHDH